MHPKHACGERGAHLAGRRHGRPLRPRAGPRVRARAGRAAGRPRRRAGHRGAARREGQVARAVRGGHGRGRPHRRAGARVVDRRVVHLRTARPAARERGLGVRARSLRSGGRLCEGALSLHVAEHRLQGPAGPSSLGGCATHTSPGRPHTWCAAQQRPLRGFGTDVTGPAQARRRALKKKKKQAGKMGHTAAPDSSGPAGDACCAGAAAAGRAGDAAGCASYSACSRRASCSSVSPAGAHVRPGITAPSDMHCTTSDMHCTPGSFTYRRWRWRYQTRCPSQHWGTSAVKSQLERPRGRYAS